jgi:hypothetical protein
MPELINGTGLPE